jgi:hypothetical protein
MALFTLPTRVLTKSMVVASLTKVSVELLLLPATLKVSLCLKRIENVGLLDRVTRALKALLEIVLIRHAAVHCYKLRGRSYPRNETIKRPV